MALTEQHEPEATTRKPKPSDSCNADFGSFSTFVFSLFGLIRTGGCFGRTEESSWDDNCQVSASSSVERMEGRTDGWMEDSLKIEER